MQLLRAMDVMALCEKHRETGECKLDVGRCTACVLATFEAATEAHDARDAMKILADLVEDLTNHELKFGRQHDAEEAFSALFKAVVQVVSGNQELSDALDDVAKVEVKRRRRCVEFECGLDAWVDEVENDHQRFSRFLQVQCPANTKVTLDRVEAIEKLHVQCQGCGEHEAEHERRADVLTAAPFFVIHLKQFGANAARRFQFPATLKLPAVRGGEAVEYRAHALIEHVGTQATGGHYNAVAWDLVTDRWYRCDDEVVRPCEGVTGPDGWTVPGVSPYLIAYSRFTSAAPPRLAPAQGPPLRVVTWNVNGLRTVDSEARTRAVIAELQRMEPCDVICLQEVTPSQAEAFRDALKSWAWHDGDDRSAYTCMLGLRSGHGSAPISWTDLEGGAGMLTADVEHAAGSLRVVCAHLAAGRLASRTRAAQLTEALDRGADIVAGDVNIGSADAIDVGKWRDAWIEAGTPQEAKYTWDAVENALVPRRGFFKPRQRFDRVYLAEGAPWSVKELRLVGSATCSDHFGVLVTLASAGE